MFIRNETRSERAGDILFPLIENRSYFYIVLSLLGLSRSQPRMTSESNVDYLKLSGLYPEWDEFSLLVCDICGTIIRPQAFEKHLKTKHSIGVQVNNKPQHTALIIKHQHQEQQPTNNNHNHLNNQQQNQQPLQTQTQSQKIVINPPPPTIDICTSLSIDQHLHRDSIPINSHQTPPIGVLSKIQDRKWRNTYNVLRDAFY